MSTQKPEAAQQKPTAAQQKPTAAQPFSMNRVLLKMKYSFYSALVFFLFANPETAQIFQRVLGNYVTFASNGIPTIQGVFLQTLFFFVTMLGLMLLPSE